MKKSKRRRPCVFKPRDTLFGVPEDAVERCYRLTSLVILDLIAESHIFISWLTFSTIEDHMLAEAFPHNSI
ncbi:UNVERIFIED_CONTAM: hypothetical protein FKN15_053685 [Acipenser sinensis]